MNVPPLQDLVGKIPAASVLVGILSLAVTFIASLWSAIFRRQWHILHTLTKEGSARGENEIARFKGRSRKTYDSNRARAFDSAPTIDLRDKPRAQVNLRINEAKAAQKQAIKAKTFMNVVANSLFFGQVIVGVGISTSFVQKTLSPTVLGTLGLIVVITTAFRHQYHPDLRAQIEAEKSRQLQNLVRQSEDRIVVIETKTVNETAAADELLELLERVSSETGRITSISSPAPTALQRKSK